MKLPTRRPKERPTRPVLEFFQPGGAKWHTDVSADEVPFICMGYRFPAPGLLRGAVPSDSFDGELVVRTVTEELQPRLKPEGARVKLGTINILAFARMLAKIGHSYAVAELGLDVFRPLLTDIILGKSAAAPYLVGGDASNSPLPDKELALHQVYLQLCLTSGVEYVLAAIRLFAFVGMPRYHVVVGEVRK
jgi:hypothetical protein